MAVSVTTDLTTISAAESTTDSGTWYRLNGTSSANPAQDLDAFIQGTGCVANKMGTAIGATNTGGHFNHTTTFDLTGKHLYHWRQIVTAGNMLTKANQGVTLGLTNTTTTSTTAWSTTNYKQWFLDGSDTVKAAEGWKCYVIDPASTPNLSAGTLTLSTVKNVGFLCRQNSAVTTTVSNQFLDAVRAGTGLTAATSAGGDVVTMDAIYAVDSSVANSWGILTQSAGVYYGAGKINIGSAAQANVCNFTDADQVLVWRNYPVSSSLYAFNIVGNGSFATTLQLTGWVVRGQAGKVWDIVCGTGGVFKAYGCAFSNIQTASLSASSVMNGCSVNQSGTIDSNGATITGCSFSNQTTSQLKIDSPAEMASVTSCDFTSDGTGHAIELTALGSYTFTGISFSGYAGSSGSTGNEAVFVNVASGSVTIYADSTFSFRTSGATVSIIAGSVTATLTVSSSTGSAIQSAQVLVVASSLSGDLPYLDAATIVNSGTTATVSHTAHGMITNDKVLIKGASHYQNNGVFSITVVNANSYSCTLLSAPGSNPSGAITATWVALSGVTDSNGQISTSRVFSVDQPVAGWARKSSAPPYYKSAPVSGMIDSATGASLSALLIADE